MDPVKRAQFDSIDEHANVEPPSKKEIQKKGFYKLWSLVFESEGRFSRNQPVPAFGAEDSTKEHVDEFYNFWYNFDSWRSFEYLDEDVPDDNENRDQKRHMERKNNNARKKRKTEDTQRLRKLVDDCLAADERIKRFKVEANASKNAKRLEKEAEAQRLIEEAKKAKEDAEKQAKEKEETEKAEKAEGKKAKEAAKNAAKKNKRILRQAAKDAKYFVDGEASPAQIDLALNDTDNLIAKMEAEDLARIAASLNGKTDASTIKRIMVEEVKNLISAGKLTNGELKSLNI